MNNHAYDTIIIGAGSVGTPLAWQLAEAGQSVLVLDQFASVGQGSNKEAIGGIRATHSDPAKISLCLKSIEIFSGWRDRFGDDIGWQRGGYSFVAYRPQEEKTLKDLLTVQKKFGLNIDWHDKACLLEIVPMLNPEGLIGGTFSPGDGSASPLLSGLAFEKQAKRLGAEFHYRERAIRIRRTHGRVTGVDTDHAAYHAGTVVNAAGAWGRDVAKLAGVDVPVQPESHEAGITEPAAPFLRPMVVDIRPAGDSSNQYFYQHRTGQVIFCITPDPPIVGLDHRETSIFLPQVAKRMLEVMPCLRHLNVRRTWRGSYPMTPDGAPIVGEVKELEGYFLAVGMCGQGFMLGPGLAVLIRQWITGEDAVNAKEILAPLTMYRDFGRKEKLK
jgi:sarcosine oxidase subunit beta